MSYYNSTKTHFEGRLILYQRDLTTAAPNSKRHRPPNWYMKVKLANGKTLDRSTKRTVYEDAYQFAQAEYFRLQNAVQQGLPLDEMTFEQHWDDWHKRHVGNRTWKDARERWHRNYANRYFKPYFRHADGRSMLLSDINTGVASGYWNWRNTYWSTGPGQKLQAYNPKRRGAKTTSTRNAKSAPSPKTLRMEQSALNQILWDARELGRLTHVFKLKAPKSHEPRNRRPHFDGSEYQILTRNLRSYRDAVGPFKGTKLNSWHKLKRLQFYHFVLFLANSGLRVGEAREMRWRDVKFDQPDADSNAMIAVVEVRKNTKTQENRTVQTQPTGNETLKEWRKKSPFTGLNDYVWFGQAPVGRAQTPISDLNKSFQNFLKRVPIGGAQDGLLYCKEGERRSLYSLRHTYATLRREADVTMDDLALNMGCNRDQLEKHYSHADSNSRRGAIVKPKPSKPQAMPANDAKADETLDPIIVEAIKQLGAGTLNSDGFLAIVSAMLSAVSTNETD